MNLTVKKIIISIIIFFNFLHSAEVQELPWPKGVSFLTFLEKYSIPQKLYFDLEKEDKELCSEIVADKRFFLYTEENGDFNQVLIPVSEDIQIHMYKNSQGEVLEDEELDLELRQAPGLTAELKQAVEVCGSTQVFHEEPLEDLRRRLRVLVSCKDLGAALEEVGKEQDRVAVAQTVQRLGSCRR